MKEKKYYLTKQETGKLWSYVGEPMNPRMTLDAGLIEVDREEIRVDEFGAFVRRFIPNL
jgi:hypothetical protein